MPGFMFGPSPSLRDADFSRIATAQSALECSSNALSLQVFSTGEAMPASSSGRDG
jgi:hypothetical protein